MNHNVYHGRADVFASTPFAFTTPTFDSPSFGSIWTGFPRCLAVNSAIVVIMVLRVLITSSSTSSDVRFFVSIGLSTVEKSV